MTRALPPRILAVVREVADVRGVTMAEILGDRRHAQVARARMEAMARCRALDPAPSLPRIGVWFGRDHTTVLHACRVMAETVREAADLAGARAAERAEADAAAWRSAWGAFL
jgi:chromosomal replication initiator protein